MDRNVENEILGQVFTTHDVANYMVTLFTLKKNAKILDPCFGKGVFLKNCQLNGYNNLFGYEIDKKLYKEVKSSISGINVYNKDFLSSDDNILYDGIIMNPPYIRHEKIDLLKKYGISKKTLSNNLIYKQLPTNANLYMYFIVKAIYNLKKNGELIVIFPSTWMKTNSGKKFKNIIYNNKNITNIINVHGYAFESKAMVDVVIIKIVNNNKHIKTIEKDLYLNSNKINKLEMNKNKKIDLKLKTPFIDYADIRRGITTGYNKFFINPKTNYDKVKIISSPKQIDSFTTKNARTDFLLLADKKLHISTDKLIKNAEKKILLTKQPLTLYNKIKNNKKWYLIQTFNCDGIIFSYIIRNDLKFILNENKYLIRDNFYVISPKININLLFALLNNYYTYYQIELLGKKYGNGILKVQKYDFFSINFINIYSLKNNDIKKLNNLTIKLLSTGNKEYIESITKVISKYTNIKFNVIKKMYNDSKKNRLEVPNE